MFEVVHTDAVHTCQSQIQAQCGQDHQREKAGEGEERGSNGKQERRERGRRGPVVIFLFSSSVLLPMLEKPAEVSGKKLYSGAAWDRRNPKLACATKPDFYPQDLLSTPYSSSQQLPFTAHPTTICGG
jgi:hypothetical protein